MGLTEGDIVGLAVGDGIGEVEGVAVGSSRAGIRACGWRTGKADGWTSSANRTGSRITRRADSWTGRRRTGRADSWVGSGTDSGT